MNDDAPPTPTTSPASPVPLVAWGLLACLALAACGGEAVPDAGAASDEGMELDPDGSTYLVAQRIRTPDSRSVLLSLLPDLDARELDNGTALEVSGFTRVAAFGGKVFAFDSESSAITRYAVSADRQLVEESPSVSFAGFGITRFIRNFAFASPTRAFYLDTPGAQMIVWDPEEMAIIESFPVPEVERDGFTPGVGALVQVGDEIIAPISWSNFQTQQFVPVVAALVFSAEDGRLLRVDESDACAATGGVLDAGDGAYYLVGTSAGGFFELFGDVPVPPPCAVSGQVGSGLDDSPAIDLRALTGAPFVDGAASAGPGRFITQVWDADVDPESVTDPFRFGELELWRFAVVDIAAETVDVADTLPLDRRSSFGSFRAGGEALVPVLGAPGAGPTTLYRLTDGGPVESVTVTGELQRVVQVR